MLFDIVYLLLGLALLLIIGYRRQIVYALYYLIIVRGQRGAGGPPSDIAEGTARIAPQVAPETLERLRELYEYTQTASAEFQKLFDEEAARLGLSMERGEYGYLSNLVTGWHSRV